MNQGLRKIMAYIDYMHAGYRPLRPIKVDNQDAN
jgi:hypothetical protein